MSISCKNDDSDITETLTEKTDKTGEKTDEKNGKIINGEASKELPVVSVPGFYSAAEAYFSPDGKSLIFNAKLKKEDEGFSTFTVKTDGSDRIQINDIGDDA